MGSSQSAGRHLFIGDVHGCIDELKDLLEKLAPTHADTVVFVGDLVAKGPDSKAVVALAKLLGAKAVRGNHDERVLQWKRARDAGDKPPELKPAHQQVVQTLTDNEWNYLESLPYYLRFPELNAIVVHAGIVPGRPLAKQDPQEMTTIRTVTPDGEASKRLDGGELWASVYQGPEEIIFGHDAVTGLQHHPHAIGLDSGCVYGKALTAYVLPERRLISVRARRAYVKPERRGET